MQCICSCFVTMNSFDTIVVTSSISIDCIVCKNKVKDTCLVCTLCRIPIGHNECVKQWLQRRGTCPNCMKECR